MSLSGALESFPIVEVLKLVARSGKNGVLRIDAQGLEARLYLEDGRLTYGTTRRDEDFHSKLVEANMVDERAWVDVERRERTISDILKEGATREQLEEFMLDQVSDVIFRVLREASGRFAFSEDVSPRFDTGVALEVEASVTEANSRLGRWKEIEEVIPSVAFHLTVNPEPNSEGSVVVAADEWKVLCFMAGASSVEELSRKQGWSEFRSAQLMANMVRRGLLVLADEVPSGRYSYGEEAAEAARDSFQVIGSRPREPRSGGSVDESEATSDEAELAASVLSEVSDSDGDRGVLQRRKGLGSIVRESERS
jgi:hypothetical protein